MQTWEAQEAEKAEQGNQCHCSLYHNMLLTEPVDKHGC